jgi:dTDP-4-amino-4,6-dideoxygalactose transaminase
LGTFSFDMGKSITTGEGGMIITDDEELYNRAAEFSDHGHMHQAGLPRGLDPRRAPGLNYRLSEVAAAVGLAQLGKLDYILTRQKENKKRLKEAILQTPGLTFREFADEPGSQGDTLIFRLPSREKASNMAKLLAERGFGSKILPEALDWHYAGAWSHIFRNYPGYRVEDLPSHWPRTGELLTSSIALPIWVNMPEEQCR